MLLFSELQEVEIPEVSALMMRLFRDQIAGDFSPAARAGIRQYMSEQALYARHNFHHFALVCRLNRATRLPVTVPPWQHLNPKQDANLGQNTPEDERSAPIVGIIEVREHRHVSLLFVDAKYQRRGIARALLGQAIARCRDRRPELEEITVRAAPAAIPAYRRLGFAPDPARDEADSPALAMRLLLESVAPAR